MFLSTLLVERAILIMTYKPLLIRLPKLRDCTLSMLEGGGGAEGFCGGHETI